MFHTQVCGIWELVSVFLPRRRLPGMYLPRVTAEPNDEEPVLATDRCGQRVLALGVDNPDLATRPCCVAVLTVFRKWAGAAQPGRVLTGAVLGRAHISRNIF